MLLNNEWVNNKIKEKSKDTHRLKVKGWKEKKKKARVAVLISNKIDFQTKAIYSRRQRTLHNDKGNNPTRIYNPSKHLHTQHRST